jgi:hypothetical protein
MNVRAAIAAALVAVVGLTVPTIAQPDVAQRDVALPAVAGHQSLLSWGGQLWALDPGASKTVSGGPTTDSPSAAWIDGAGALHMKFIDTRSGYAAPSLTSVTRPRYGTYTWTLDRPSIAKLDRFAVLGLFLYSSTPTASPSTRKREIDIEHSLFGKPSPYRNTQFVVQPSWVPGHSSRFNVTTRPGTLTERFTWLPGSVTFEAFTGPAPTARSLVDRFSYAGSDVPPVTGATLLRMNLWMYFHPPVSGSGHEVVLRSFSYSPAPGQPII